MIEIFLPGMVNSVIFCLKDFLWQVRSSDIFVKARENAVNFFQNIFWVDLMIEIFLPGMVNSVIFCLKDFFVAIRSVIFFVKARENAVNFFSKYFLGRFDD